MSHSKSSLFLMELIISILFFSLASAVCVQLFAKAHVISGETVDLSHAVTEAQNLAELWYATEGDCNMVNELLPDTNMTRSSKSAIQTLYYTYDEQWELCSPTEAVYTMILENIDNLDNSVGNDVTGLINAYITVRKEDSEEPVYTLSLSHHKALKLSNASKYME